MKKCPVCGVEHSDIISVCSICGSPLSGSAPAENAAPAGNADFASDDIQAAVSSVVSATVEEHKAASSGANDFEDDSPFVVNAMREDGEKKPSAAAREVKTPSRSNAPRRAYYSKKVTPETPKAEPAKSEQSKAADPAVDTTVVAAVSAQKVYEATQNAINARNAQAAQKSEEQETEQVEWSQRKHKRKNGSNGVMIAACALVLLLIIALLIFAAKMLFGGDDSTKPADDGNNANVSDDNNPGGGTTENEPGDTTILPDDTQDAQDNTDDPADTETPDDSNVPNDNSTEDPDASTLDNSGDGNAPADQTDESDAEQPNSEQPAGNDEQPVVVPAELPAITDVDDTVYATTAVNVRDYPNVETSNVINVLAQGQAVKRTGTTSIGWSRVELSDGTVGYVSDSYLSTSKDDAQTGNNNDNTGSGSVAYVNTGANVRSEPNGEILTALPEGTEVKLTGTVSGNWTQITAGGITGYIYTPYLTTSGSTGGNNSGNGTEQPKVTVKETNDTVYATTAVNVRDYPSASTGKVLTALTKGQEVKRIGTTANGWSQIKVGNTTGYVYSDYLSTSKSGGSDNSGNKNNNNNSSKSGGYILPDSATRNYTKSELSGLSASQLRLARNEIYARHGRKFNDASLREYFEGKSWYSGTVDAATFDANVSSYLNSYELANLKLIQEVENG